MKKIVVIEDQAETRNLFIEGLKVEGFQAIGAENGFVGIHLAQEHLPDLILCDVIIPQLDGYSVLTTLRADPVTATVPFIFVTAKGTRADFRKGMELGADDYLSKPCTVDELLRAITACLEKPHRGASGWPFMKSTTLLLDINCLSRLFNSSVVSFFSGSVRVTPGTLRCVAIAVVSAAASAPAIRESNVWPCYQKCF